MGAPARDLHRIFAAHDGGKIEVRSRICIRTRATLSRVYTPGVAEVSRAIARNPALATRYTIAGRTIAVITDGSAVLGLGNIGPQAALPVMEGKCAIFREFAGLNAFPICLATQDTAAIVAAVRAIAPVFAAVNLEDIAAPRCFAIEAQLQDLGIPVMHDDQHGTAVVVLAALTNACRVVGKRFADLRVAIAGAGAAGATIATFLAPRVADVIVADSRGIIHRTRDDLTPEKRALAEVTNRSGACGALADAFTGADVGIGVSRPGAITPAMIRAMARDPIVFAMANPVPEIMPRAARAAGAVIVATGRSDFPNQVNNALGYPGIFRGAIDARATRITDAMQVAAADALAGIIRRPAADRIIPSIFDRRVVPTVARAVAEAWLAGQRDHAR